MVESGRHRIVLMNPGITDITHVHGVAVTTVPEMVPEFHRLPHAFRVQSRPDITKDERFEVIDTFANSIRAVDIQGKKFEFCLFCIAACIPLPIPFCVFVHRSQK